MAKTFADLVVDRVLSARPTRTDVRAADFTVERDPVDHWALRVACPRWWPDHVERFAVEPTDTAAGVGDRVLVWLLATKASYFEARCREAEDARPLALAATALSSAEQSGALAGALARFASVAGERGDAAEPFTLVEAREPDYDFGACHGASWRRRARLVFQSDDAAGWRVDVSVDRDVFRRAMIGFRNLKTKHPVRAYVVICNLPPAPAEGA
jgi:hypothetical protein